MSRDRRERVTIPEAAERLGITQSAVRQRIRRGSISWEKGEDRRTYVYISPDVTARHGVEDTSRDELVEELRDRVRSLEEQLARRDAIMLRLTESIGQLQAPQEPSESPQTASEGSGSTQGREEPQERTSRRSWWRRVFGGWEER